MDMDATRNGVNRHLSVAISAPNRGSRQPLGAFRGSVFGYGDTPRLIPVGAFKGASSYGWPLASNRNRRRFPEQDCGGQRSQLQDGLSPLFLSYCEISGSIASAATNTIDARGYSGRTSRSRSHQVDQLVWLPDKVFDSQPGKGGRDFFSAVGAGENDFKIGAQLPGLFEDFPTGHPRQRNVQQHSQVVDQAPS